MKPILVDFDNDRLSKLEQMKSTTTLPRNELIRLAVDFYYNHPDEWASNSYRDHDCQEAIDQPPAGTA